MDGNCEGSEASTSPATCCESSAVARRNQELGVIIKFAGIKLIKGASCDSYAQQVAQRRNSFSRGLNVQVRLVGSKLSLCAREEIVSSSSIIGQVRMRVSRTDRDRAAADGTE